LVRLKDPPATDRFITELGQVIPEMEAWMNDLIEVDCAQRIYRTIAHRSWWKSSGAKTSEPKDTTFRVMPSQLSAPLCDPKFERRFNNTLYGDMGQVAQMFGINMDD
jgi:hypothetical protein